MKHVVTVYLIFSLILLLLIGFNIIPTNHSLFEWFFFFLFGYSVLLVSVNIKG